MKPKIERENKNKVSNLKDKSLQKSKVKKTATKGKDEKKKFLKKKSSKKVDKEDKKLKVVVNLTKCSQNWKNIATQIPKPLFKRQNKKLTANLSNEDKSNKQKKPTEIHKEKEEKPKNDIWFEVDNVFIGEKSETSQDSKGKTAKITKIIGIDCEMVGVGDNGQDSILARISLVNQFGECIYDKYAIPTEKVTDYRTSVSGIRPEDLKKENNAIEFHIIQKEVAEIIKDRILVGHAIHNDLKVLFLSHPKKKIRDTQKCKVFRRISPSLGGLSSLKNLAKTILGITIQEGEHNSILDAQVAMKLYTSYKKDWEADIKNQKMSKKEVKELSDKSAIIQNGQLKEIDDSGINIKTGNETHKRYLINKIKKRQKFSKKFLNKK